MRIGLDLDNTIIFYDEAFVKAGIERNLLPQGFKGTKQQLRDAIRLTHGETQWQALQGYVYGKGLGLASFFPGVETFLKSAKDAGHELLIISHKTEFGHFDPERINLRDAARAWLHARGIVNYMPDSHIHFAPTRADKVSLIASHAPDWFIDDLAEVFEEPHFPHTTRKVLFCSDTTPGHWETCSDWSAIHTLILGSK